MHHIQEVIQQNLHDHDEEHQVKLEEGHFSFICILYYSKKKPNLKIHTSHFEIVLSVRICFCA